MLPKVSCFLLVLLVAELQCAPAKIGGGFKAGASGETSLTGGGSLSGTLTDPKLLHYGATGILGANAKGGLNGGAYGFINNKRVGGEGQVNGNIGGLVKDVFEGDIGVDKNGNAVLGGTNRASAAGEIGGGASGSAGTNEDATGYILKYGGKSALDDLHNIW